MPDTQQQETIVLPKDKPSPAEPEVIDGEVTLLELPAEPDATSPNAEQQAPHGEIIVGVPPEQEPPAPRPRSRQTRTIFRSLSSLSKSEGVYVQPSSACSTMHSDLVIPQWVQ